MVKVLAVPSPSTPVSLCVSEPVDSNGPGQRAATACFERIMPIKVLGKAVVPLQASLIEIVSFPRNCMQPAEHGCK